MATKKEWDAMNSINPHFTFRERTAFLVGFRLGRADALEAAARVAEAAAEDWEGLNCNGGDIDRKHVGDSSSAATIVASRIRATKEGK